MAPIPETDGAMQDLLTAARDASRRHAWREAFDLFTRADVPDAPEGLTGDDLEAMAEAAWFIGRADLDIEITERAFHQREVDGDRTRAGYLAIFIGRKHWYVGKSSIASGWIRRAERLLQSDEATYAHGFLALAGSEVAAGSGDPETALTLGDRALEIGEGTSHPDLLASARSQLGALKIGSGATAEGVALMEEASVAAVNGELSPFISGITACRMISACRDLSDFRRASEWIEATERYCDRQSLEGFPGVCRVHRAEVTSLAGEWARAEAELERATAELEGYRAGPPEAEAYYVLGDIRRLRGDLESAEVALRDAHARGRSPHPALALIRLARGDVQAAATAIEGALADETWDRWARARLLPAQVEIAVAAGRVDRARAAVDELTDTVGGYPSPALEAGAAVARGRVLVAEGDAAAAIRELRSGITAWRTVGAPHEVARARTVLARAMRRQGDEGGADLELQAALDAFRSLGAIPDVTATERELAAAEERRNRPHVDHRAFMFTDIVGSTTLAEALGDEAWDRLLRWHDEMLRRLVERGAGSVVNTTGDGLFAAFDDATAAVDCAIAIQRALRDHRLSTGFAPPVRIGIHAGDATVHAGDYSGMAVHVAARVGALAAGGEILASEATIAEAGRGAASAVREVAVKGVSAPIMVATIAWD